MKEYFSHDYNARNDKKLIRLFMKYGVTGIGIYWCIIEMLYEESGYLDISEYERIAFELRTEYDIVKNVVENFDLFEINDNRFYSESALDRLNQRIEKSEKARESVMKRWDKYERNTNVQEPKNKRNTSKIKENKIKESKIPDFVQLEFKESFQNWMEYKADRKEKYKSEKSEKAFYNKLVRLSKKDPAIAAEIIEQSMANNWAGIFELKSNNNGAKSKTELQVERNMADLERRIAASEAEDN